MADTQKLLAKLEGLHTQRTRARAELDAVTQRTKDLVIELMSNHDVSERAIAKASGVSRQTIRVWTGSDDQWPERKGSPE